MSVDPRGDLVAGVPLVSKLAWPLTYAYPVHRIGPDHQPLAPPAQPTHLVVWRDADDEVRFMEANAVTARLLQLMVPGRATGRRLLERIAKELKHPQPEVVVNEGAAILAGLRERGIIIGVSSRGAQRRGIS